MTFACTLNRIEFKCIDWLLNWFEVNSTWIKNKFNNWIKIQLKKIEMQIGGEGIENLLMDMMLKKKT
jgi:hypothetical protein